MSKLLALAGAAFVALATVATQADASTYFVDYSGTSAANGDFTAELTIDVLDETNTISAISGTRNGIAVTGLSGYASADNAFSPVNPYVSFAGLSYSTDGGPDYNIFYDGTSLFELNNVLSPGGYADGDAPITSISVSQVPEPASWAMFIGGFGMLGGSMRRQRRVTVTTAFA